MEELFPLDYTEKPILKKYIGYLHQMVELLRKEMESNPSKDADLEILKDIMVTIQRRIEFDGEMVELDTILRLHFPGDYDTSSLLDYPLSGIN